MKFILYTLIFFLLSCSEFIKATQELDESDLYSSSKISLFFSHNIQGETHPCGCRNFPLGGLPNTYGILKSSKNPSLYVDTGDTFFISSTIPESIKDSSLFTANKIAEAFDMMDLKYFVPGDYDFAMGMSFLENISHKHKFKFLISNASESNKIKHIEYAKIKTQDHTLFFLGVVDPQLIKSNYRSNFTEPTTALKKQLRKIHTKYPKIKKRFILLSHLGMQFDKKIAKEFSQFDWIIGAHNQSFLKSPVEINQSKIVQALSRNHHLGKIILTPSKKLEKYSLVAADEKAEDLIAQNPLKQWLLKFKNELNQIQKEEQEKLGGSFSSKQDEISVTNLSCLDCHDTQYEFWQKTQHSIAFLTLVKNKAMNNTSCIKCHSLKFQKEDGFAKTKHIVKSSAKDFKADKYLAEMMKLVPSKAVRELSNEETLSISKKWHELDEQNSITHNFANIQCLHCHTNKNSDHPFIPTKTKSADYKSQCLKCHNADQSPEWYKKGTNGVATSLNNEYFAKKLKMVSCPKIEN